MQCLPCTVRLVATVANKIEYIMSCMGNQSVTMRITFFVEIISQHLTTADVKIMGGCSLKTQIELFWPWKTPSECRDFK